MTETKFFEAGKTYEVYLKTGAVKKFKCIQSDKETLIIRGSYEGGKEKAYRAEPTWRTLNDKQNGNSPYAHIITINKTIGNKCSSNDEL